MKNELQQLLPVDPAFGPLSHVTDQCAVILPVTEPVDALDTCLTSLMESAARLRDDGTPTVIYVILAGRDTESALIASRYPVHLITADQTDAAQMRSIGARAALSAGATWLAFTEPSAVVSETWLKDQLGCGAELVLGSVEVTDRFLNFDLPEHSSMGFFHDEDKLEPANFGLNARALTIYQLVAERDGGIDRSLARKLKGLGVVISRCDKPLVYRRSQHGAAEFAMLPDFAAPSYGLTSPHGPCLGPASSRSHPCGGRQC
jgi:hypothetical protein